MCLEHAEAERREREMTGLGRRMAVVALLLGTGIVATLPGRANAVPTDSRVRVEWTAAAAGQGESHIFG